MIKGVHTLFYSSQPAALREFLRDKLGLPAVDIGEGWLIFSPAEADMGIHPTDGDPPSGTANISFYCDDLEATMAELRAKGVELGAVADRGWGLVTNMKVPGGFEIMLYQPKYGR